MLKIIALLFSFIMSTSQASSLPIISGVGGDFSAIDSHNQMINFYDYKGKVVVLAFGYTNCADICPFTLGYFKNLYETLGLETQQKTRFVFISIDPEYDTPDHLNAYMGHFNKDFIGITGSQKQIAYATSLFQAKYQALADHAISTQDMRRVEHKETLDGKEDKAKLFTHSVTIYLLDKQSRVRALEYTGTSIDDFASNIKELINE